ncbi:MAG: DegT/DnrJ/EryC1/StrS family aminotransferase, partial [Candidatus Bathyarchaeia archaeon]
PKVTDEDKKALIEVLESRRWCRVGGYGQGLQESKAELFEKSFSEYHNAKYGIAVANGTVALELALKTVGVGFGDEVVVPAVTFIATASAVTEVGAIPIFADIDPETGAISSKSLKDSITERTKAVIVVHYGGYPADFDEILPITKEYDLFLIEDCAQAHGSEWKGRKVGAIGDMGGFSFQESKSITAGEGGIVLTDDEELDNRAKLIHNIGRVLGRPGYEHYILSSNYRMTEFQAALLLSKMKTLPQEIETKFSNGSYLAEKLRKIDGVEPLKKDPRITKRGYYLFAFKYEAEEFNGLPKQKFAEALTAEGVPTYLGYGMPLYKQFAFKKENLTKVIPKGFKVPDYEKLRLPGAEEFTAKEVTLPHPILLVDKEYLDLIASSIEKIKDNVDELL